MYREAAPDRGSWERAFHGARDLNVDLGKSVSPLIWERGEGRASICFLKGISHVAFQ